MNIFNQWLQELSQELKGISEDDRADILESYKEQINEMIALEVTEEEILSKLGSPKKVAQEVKESLDYVEVPLETKKESVEVTLKSNRDYIRQIVKVILLIACLFVTVPFFMTSIRFIMGGLFISSLSIGFTIASFGLALLFLNLAIASIYIGYIVCKRFNLK